KCPDRLKNKHLKKYRHGKNHNHLSAVQSTNLNASINFMRNQSQLIRTVNNYVDVSSWKKAKISPEILNWHNIPAVKDNAFRLITALVEAEFAKKKTSDETTPLVDDHNYTMKLIEKKLTPPLTDHDISIIHQ
ncbi:unnamed protein product, partial [Rotaria sp. Silwood1]